VFVISGHRSEETSHLHSLAGSRGRVCCAAHHSLLVIALRRQVKIKQNDVVYVDSGSSSPTVIHVIPEGNVVGGVTSLGDDVFVVRYSQQKIEVYDAKTFTLQRHITVPRLGNCCLGLLACSYNKHLYASDWFNNSVHRVDLSGSNAVMKWSVARRPAGLSLNSEHNLLVVSQGESKLQIFTTHGTLLQNIQLQADIEYPRHAVQLPTGQFLVSHGAVSGGSLHRLCLVGVDGAVVRSYGGVEGSELTQMNCPAGLAVDRQGRVLVADWYNNRLLVIDESLSSAHEMSVSVDGGLNGPYSLWYDQSRRRLYIGEENGGRVIVIDNLKDFNHTLVQCHRYNYRTTLVFTVRADPVRPMLSGYANAVCRPP